MPRNSGPSIQIDLNEFKLYIHLKSRTQLTLHFNSPSRSFYLSVIALVVNEMKKLGKIKSIPLQEHLEVLVLLNESIGFAAGSSEKENLLSRIYRKWKDALPNLEEAPLFKVLGRKKEEGDGSIGKIYSFTDADKDGWANLFEYMGSHENVKLKFAIDKIGVDLNETSIIFGDSSDGDGWDRFISSLRKEEKKEPDPVEEPAIPEPPVISISPSQEQKRQRKLSWLSHYRWGLLVVVGAMLTAVIWRAYLSPAPVEKASVDRMKYPLPDKPSIAVLPFVNMSEDPKQEILCDAMTDSIITALTKIPGLFVIARNSTFVYKGKPVKVRQVSEELGVQYVLQGNLQRSGDRIRVTAQLIDALTGFHLWAERYNGDLKDIFALQDEITRKVLTATHVKLTGGELSNWEKSAGKYYRGEQALDCYLKFLQASDYLDRWNIADTNSARKIAEEAISMYPESPIIHLCLSWVYLNDYWLVNTNSPEETLTKSMDLAQRTLAMDDSISWAHAHLSNIYHLKGEHDEAIAEGERAVSLNPGGTGELHAYANALRFAGRSEEALPLYQKAIRLNPSGASFIYVGYAAALNKTGRVEEAVTALKKANQISPDSLLNHALLTAIYSGMGRDKEARAEAAEVLRINPKFSVDKWAKAVGYKNQSDTDRMVDNLRKAGLK